MVEYNIQQTDLRDAESFLATFMSEQVTEASFSRGSAVYDFLVKGFASLYAYLRGEVDRITVRQSLKRIQEELTDDDDIAQAVDEILSNWFVSRKDGERSRATVRLHFTERVAQNISVAARFYRTSTLYFFIDTTSNSYIISENQLLPVYDARGELEDYVVDVPMVAANVGTTYDVSAGNFVRVDAPGGIPYFSYAENVDDFEGGKNIESTDELIIRAETAITVRNLINNRSCDTVLQEEFPSVLDTLTIGMGESEMVRDTLCESYRHLKLHTGGKYDTYTDLPLTTVEDNLTIGGYFARGDGIASVFRDPELTYDLGATFTSLGVQPGHVIHVRSGILDSPRTHIIAAVFDHELHVGDSDSFTEASDDFLSQTENKVVYSIGWFAPSFANIEFPPPSSLTVRTAAASTNSAYVNIPYGTSRKIQQSGKVVLTGKPVQDIIAVEITNPSSTLDSLKDISTGLVSFPNRINTLPVYQAEPSELTYNVTTSNPMFSQSAKAVNLLTVGFDYSGPPIFTMGDFDGLNLRVSYRTMSSFSNIHSYVESRDVRVASANHLVRARHPVWLEMVVYYRLKPITSDVLDEEEAAAVVASHINNFNPKDDLDTSDIETILRINFDVIGAVYPLTINYTLNSPDGQQLEYQTTDLVSLFPTNTNNVELLNGQDVTPTPEMQALGIPYIRTDVENGADPEDVPSNVSTELSTYLKQLGVSDRTIRYRTSVDRIQILQRS